MQVSAITLRTANGYNMSSHLPYDTDEIIGDTSFNSLRPFSQKKTVSQSSMPQLYDSINEWQLFCHKQILGGKLNIIA